MWLNVTWLGGSSRLTYRPGRNESFYKLQSLLLPLVWTCSHPKPDKVLSLSHLKRRMENEWYSTVRLCPASSSSELELCSLAAVTDSQTLLRLLVHFLFNFGGLDNSAAWMSYVKWGQAWLVLGWGDLQGKYRCEPAQSVMVIQEVAQFP